LKVYLRGLVIVLAACFGAVRLREKSLFSNFTPADAFTEVHKELTPPLGKEGVAPRIDCMNVRGESGKWVQDWTYANRTNYQNYGSYSTYHLAAQCFKPMPEQPFRLATAWRWEDDNCPVTEITREGFCRVCEKLNITRIISAGDSLSQQFRFLLLSLAGNPPKGRAVNFNGCQ